MRASSLLLSAILLVAGCGGARAGSGGGFFSDDAGDDAGGESCMAGSVSPCLCSDGRSGQSACSPAGVAGACVCGVDGVDGGVANDLGSPGIDVPVARDTGGPGIDVPGPGPGAFGAPCARLTDCMSGVCLPTGRCSRPCGSTGECPGSWSCTSLPGIGPVCACTPRGAEVCNDIDDDCDGVVDEGTMRCNGRCVDVASDSSNCGGCGVLCGGGTSCVGGACACPASRSLACGGRCVDGRTDATNCGTCGNVCPSGSSCTNGVCQRTGVCPSSCTSSSQCAVCATPGETGTYCCVSGLCIYMSSSTCGGLPTDGGLPDVELPSDTGSGAADARAD